MKSDNEIRQEDGGRNKTKHFHPRFDNLSTLNAIYRAK
jgi:hypothetical protein